MSAGTRPKARFKSGDYLTIDNGQRNAFVKVIAVIEGPVQHLYALQRWGHKFKWFTEYEMFAEADFTTCLGKGPDLKLWDTIAVGDMLECNGCNNPYYERHTHMVIARVGQLVMLSNAPVKLDADKTRAVAEQLDSLTNDAFGLSELAENAIKSSKPYSSSRNAQKISQKDWSDIEHLAWLNWRIIRE